MAPMHVGLREEGKKEARKSQLPNARFGPTWAQFDQVFGAIS